jgi:hypothetical protein
MKETGTTPTKLSTTHGFVPGVAYLALDVADKTQSTVIAVLQDARVEIKAVFDHGVDLVEKASASAFRFAKKLGQRVDEGVAETLGNTERLLGGAVKSARETTHKAAELAQTAGNGITGQTASA